MLMHDTKDHIFRYKYLPFTDGSLQVIKSGTIKFSSPSAFNDPFDCKPSYTLDLKSKPSSKEKHLMKRIGDFEGISPARRLQNLQKYRARIDKKVKSGGFIDDINRQYGVFCLSRNPLSILMWSHYANNHEGFLIEFKIPIRGNENDAKDLKNLLVPFPITYSKNRPVLDVFEDATHESLKKHLLTKSIDWKYEEEERVIDHIRGPGIHSYNRNAILCSVVAGIKMSEDDFNILRKIVSDVNRELNVEIGTYRAIEIPGMYALSVPRHERLDLMKFKDT